MHHLIGCVNANGAVNMSRKNRRSRGVSVATIPSKPASGPVRISVADIVIRNNPGCVQPVGRLDDKLKTVLPSVSKPTGSPPTVAGVPVVEMPKPDVEKIKHIMPATVASTPIEGAITPEEIWAIAKANAEYYINTALADGCKKLWFQYPKYRHQYSEHVLVDGPMIDDLFRAAAPNRNMGMEDVAKYQRDFEKDQWFRTHEGVGIDVLGRFFDGQQTLTALKRSGKSWPLYFTWNCDAASIMVVDSGRSRDNRQKLALVMPDVKMAGKLPSVCRSLMRGTTQTKTKWSVLEMSEFALQHKEALEWLNDNFDTSARADVQAAVAKAYLWFGQEKIAKFCQEFSDAELIPGRPARALHLYLNKDKAKGDSPVTVYLKACNALTYAANEKPMEKLYEVGSDLFEWQPGWVVPSNAPRNKG